MLLGWGLEQIANSRCSRPQFLLSTPAAAEVRSDSNTADSGTSSDFDFDTDSDTDFADSHYLVEKVDDTAISAVAVRSDQQAENLTRFLLVEPWFKAWLMEQVARLKRFLNSGRLRDAGCFDSFRSLNSCMWKASTDDLDTNYFGKYCTEVDLAGIAETNTHACHFFLITERNSEL